MQAFKRACLTVIGVLGAISPVMAMMPNPDVKPYTNHSVEVDLGVDVAPQHFATVKVVPLGEGKFNIALRCENGEPGGSTDAVFVVEFRDGDKVLRNYSKECHLKRSGGGLFGLGGGNQVVTTNDTIDLSGVLDRVSNVKFAGYQAPPGFPPSLVSVIPEIKETGTLADFTHLYDEALKLPIDELRRLSPAGAKACEQLGCGKVPADQVSGVISSALVKKATDSENGVKDWQAWAATFSSIFTLGGFLISYASFVRAGRAERKASEAADLAERSVSAQSTADEVVALEEG